MCSRGENLSQIDLRRVWTLFKVNVAIAATCFVGLWFLGNTPPWNYVFVTGIAWVTISSLEFLRALRKVRRLLGVI